MGPNLKFIQELCSCPDAMRQTGTMKQEDIKKNCSVYEVSYILNRIKDRKVKTYKYTRMVC